MAKRLLSVSIASVVLGVAPALAQEGLKLTAGSISFGGLYSNETSRNPFRFYEYRDMYSSIIGDIDLRMRSDEGYLDAFIENIGRTDQFFDLKGGRYNLFKYEVYGDWLQHNLSMRPDGATSPYSGVGTSTLGARFPALTPANIFNSQASWNDSFNFATNRRNIGGMIEFSNIYVSPWYLRFDANEVRTTGVSAAVGSGALGTSPGNGFIDLPMPVDYATRNWVVEGGYSTKQAQFSVNFLKSDFTNENQILKWTNPFFGGNQLDSTTLAPDSQLWKVAANGAWRQLPWNSTLAGRFTYGEVTSTTNILGAMLTTGPTYAATGASNSNFDGKVKNTSFTLSWTANPARAVDSRVYYNYYDKKNESNEITFVSTALGCPPAAPCRTELFSYKRNNAGVDVGYRFSGVNRVSGIIDYNYMDQVRADYPNTTQWTYGVEWRNSSLDWLGARLGLSYITRRSDFNLGAAGPTANDPGFLERYVARFDLSNVDQTRVKLVLDSSPIPLLDLGFEGYWKWNDYKDNNFGFSPVVGRKYDTRQEYYASVSYGDPNAFRVTAFGDIEFIQYDSYHRNIGNVTGTGTCVPAAPNCFNPNTPPNSTAYNWDATNNDRNWALGLGTDWKALDRLTIKGAAIWSRTQGWVDLASQNNFGNPFPIRSYDTSSKVTLNLKGIYQYNKNWEFTGGYAYETYSYSDDQYNGYQYVIPSGAPPNYPATSYLSGAYAFPNYSANIVYAMAKYKF